MALVRLELDEELVAALKALGIRLTAHISTVLLAGWAAVLGRLSGQTDLVIGTSMGSRGRREVEGVIGSFVNPLPVRVKIRGFRIEPGRSRPSCRRTRRCGRRG